MSLTAADRALIAGDGTPDLPPGLPPLTRLLQPNSPELAPGGDDYLEGAYAGDFVTTHQGERILIKGSIGFAFVPVAFELNFVEYAPSRGGFIAAHGAEKPADAVWTDASDAPDGKAGYYNARGNRVEQTIYAHLLLLAHDGGHAPRGATFAFRSTSLAVGRDFANRASRLKVENENIGGIVIGKWQMRSRLERQNDYRWYLPQVAMIGKLGEIAGPSLSEVRLAAQLRANFKQNLPWAPEPPEPPPITVDKTPTSPTPRPIITSGRAESRAWSLEGPPPIDSVPDSPGEFDRVEF
jgi:hypothetical protein